MCLRRPTVATHARPLPQVLIRWAVQRGTSVLPKSVNPTRIAANMDVLSWALPEQDFQALSSLATQVAARACGRAGGRACVRTAATAPRPVARADPDGAGPLPAEPRRALPHAGRAVGRVGRRAAAPRLRLREAAGAIKRIGSLLLL